MPFTGIDVELSDGTPLADGIQQGLSTSGTVDMPIDATLRVVSTGDGFTVPLDPVSLTEDAEYSWFFAGAGGGAGWRVEVIEDTFPDPIPGVSHVRFVVARQNVSEPATILVDGGILVENIGWNQTFISGFQAVGEGQHDLAMDVDGGDYWDRSFPRFSTEDGGYYTIVINSNANVGGEELFATVSEY